MNHIELLKSTDDKTYKIIENIYKSEKISHAFIFSARKGVDTSPAASALISALISNSNVFDDPSIARDYRFYPDYHLVDGNKDEGVKKDDVIDVINKMQTTPLDEKGVKILHIKNIEFLNINSVNSLLKFIEEPHKNSYVIITTNNMSVVLNTIKSRCQEIRVNTKDNTAIMKQLQNSSVHEIHASILASLSNNLEELLEIYNDASYNRDYEGLFFALAKGITNVNYLSSFLMSTITKKNYKRILTTLLLFFQDIANFKVESRTILFYDQISLLGRYINSNFNIYKAFEILDEFFVLLESNVNFDLHKTQMIMRLESCYE